MKKDGVLKVLKGLKTEVKRKYKAELRGVFGSYVKGKVKKDSDIDILVDFEERADLLDLTGLALFLQEKLKRKVDVVPARSLREELRKNILTETIYL